MQTEKYREGRISNIVDLKEELESFHHRGKFQRSHFFLKIRTKKIVEDGTEKVSRTYHSEKQLSRPLPFATVCHFSRSPSSRNYAPFPLISALLSRTFTNRAFPSVYNAPLRAPYKSMHTHTRLLVPFCKWRRSAPMSSILHKLDAVVYFAFPLARSAPSFPPCFQNPRQNSSLNEREEN